MAAAKISKEHGPQDPNGTADPGQTDPRTRPKTPDPTTAPEVLIMLPAAFKITDVHTGKRRDYFSWLHQNHNTDVFHRNAKTLFEPHYQT